MYPVYDFTDKPEVPKTPLGCAGYFIGFCVFGLLLLAVVKWLG